ncbi:hypothetical protein ACFX12_030904 [Malus domestica]
MHNLRKLKSKGAGGSQLVADEIAGGDVRDAEKVTEAGGVGSFFDVRATEGDPLDISVLDVVCLVDLEPTSIFVR